MAMCRKCGADSSGRFCATCGTHVSDADLPENAACFLCYILWALSGVIFLAMAPYNRSKLVRFHAWQSILTSAVLFVAWFAVLLVATLLRILPWIGGPIASLLLGVFGIAMTGLWLLLMFKAYQGGSLDLPYVSKFAQKQA